MCKLCGSPELAPTRSGNWALTQPITDFINIVHDYLGSYPCIKCRASFNANKANRSSDASIDSIILRKLYRSYVLPNYTAAQRRRSRMSKANCHRKQFRILGIEAVVTRHKTSYHPTVNDANRKHYLGTYPTLQEAIQTKLDYCLANNHPKAVAQLTNKLKELQCQH